VRLAVISIPPIEAVVGLAEARFGAPFGLETGFEVGIVGGDDPFDGVHPVLQAAREQVKLVEQLLVLMGDRG
jgi:hypothetical protein